MTNLAEFPIRAPDLWVTKRQLADHPSIRRSTRWIEQQMRLGLPSAMRRNRRVFHLPTALPWLEEHRPDLAGTNARTQHVPPPEPPEVINGEPAADDDAAGTEAEGETPPAAVEPEQVDALEQRIAVLEQRVAELEAGPPAA